MNEPERNALAEEDLSTLFTRLGYSDAVALHTAVEQREAALRAGEAGKQERVAHSMSEYRRVTAQGGEIAKPNEGRQEDSPSVSRERGIAEAAGSSPAATSVKSPSFSPPADPSPAAREQDLFTIARFVGLPGEKLTAFLGVLRAAGLEVDLVKRIQALERYERMYQEAVAVQGDDEVLRYVTSGNAIPVTRCTVSADLIRQLVADRAALTAERAPGAERGPWLIFFDDQDREDEVFTSEAAARKRYADISVSWNAHLFERVHSNSRDANLAATQPDLAGLDAGKLWSFMRKVLLAGEALYVACKDKPYKEYHAHIDATASEWADKFSGAK